MFVIDYGKARVSSPKGFTEVSFAPYGLHYPEDIISKTLGKKHGTTFTSMYRFVLIIAP